ncbi:hypothetical protein BABINDRAFT_30999 [Babjeviella inositovora NRRL Y-12698]|uniref:Protein transport protein SEC22 n=1 Tax=Babjeviella inositovora NRRL Y-12698 TaxID=984486 RepID=A0A1E3QX61_9ASCO|nr:uncharacterized protein BABINDRAFT_30999 [Babjeviella inositovora NRRL Y-12698]ODQ82278.1 hypothetical protein BABINDRAFT_30999 [Babjeviella inositovora NRRL Y-12698]
MVKSTLIYRNDALPLCGSVDDDAEAGLLEQKKKCKLIISRITPNSESQASIESGSNYVIHYLIKDSIVYLVICDKSYSRKLAFSYLDEISNEFTKLYGPETMNPDVRPFAFAKFDSFLGKTKKVYQDARAQSNLDRLNNDLADVKKVMTKNIEDLLYRGDSLDKMTDLSSSLRAESKKYRKSAQKINFDAMIRQYVPIACASFIFVFLLWYTLLR